MNDYTLKSAWPIVKAKESEYAAALSSVPEAGLVKPVGVTPWMAAVYAEFQRTPKLCQAAVQAPETVRECLSVAAGLGLVPGGSGGQFYLIPRKNNRAGGRMECTFIVGYKGLTELAFRHPRVHKIEAFLVMDGDEWDWRPGHEADHRYGDSDRIVKPDLSNVVGAYARAVLTVHNTTQVDAEPIIDYMTRAEILEIRGRSQAAQKGFSPWQTDPGRMARKTPIRRMCNGGSVPQSASLILAMAAEDREEGRLQAEIQEMANPVREVSGTLRAAAGLAPKVEVPEFDLVEEAVEFAQQANAEQLGLLAGVMRERFTGDDAEALAIAVSEREEELTDRSD